MHKQQHLLNFNQLTEANWQPDMMEIYEFIQWIARTSRCWKERTSIAVTSMGFSTDFKQWLPCQISRDLLNSSFPALLCFVFWFVFFLPAGDNTWKTALLLLFTTIVPTGEKQSISTITFFRVAKTLAL